MEPVIQEMYFPKYSGYKGSDFSLIAILAQAG